MVCGFGAQGLLAHQVDLTWNKSPGSMADSRELPLEKIVLVIGETGVGKSTIVNMLYNRDQVSTAASTHSQQDRKSVV